MKLYNVPRNVKIKTLEDIAGPPGEPVYPAGTVLHFNHLDGMYSLCTDRTHRILHLPASTEVEVCDQQHW